MSSGGNQVGDVVQAPDGGGPMSLQVDVRLVHQDGTAVVDGEGRAIAFGVTRDLQRKAGLPEVVGLPQALRAVVAESVGSVVRAVPQMLASLGCRPPLPDGADRWWRDNTAFAAEVTEEIRAVVEMVVAAAYPPQPMEVPTVQPGQPVLIDVEGGARMVGRLVGPATVGEDGIVSMPVAMQGAPLGPYTVAWFGGDEPAQAQDGEGR